MRGAVCCALVGVVTGAAAAGAAPGGCGGILLADVAAAAGIDFVHRRGASGAMHLPETMGAGVAWLDYDGDGWLDLYLVQSGPFPPDGSPQAANRLFRNLGGGRFVDVTAASGAGHRGYGQGVVAADADGDGAVDLYVANFGADALLRNLGDGRFAEATAAAGLGLDGWSSSAAFADADGDGDLDLYVTRYVEYDPDQPLFCGDLEAGRRDYCDPSLFSGAGDRLYRNDGGRFADVTAAAGLGEAAGNGLGVVFADLDGDGRPDLYVANDITPNFLFHNLGGMRFADISLLSGAAASREGLYEAGMGIALGDVDGDGDPDLGVTNFDVETNTLYENLGAMQFADVSAESGFGVPSFNLLGFGIAFADLDRDGDLDAYVTNGHIFERPRREQVTFEQPDLLLLGDGAGGFAAVDCPGLAARPGVGRGLAVADFDNDGDPDLTIQQSDRPARLLANGAAGRWLGVALRGRAPNSGAVGAEVTLVAGGEPQRRWALAGGSYQSSHDPRLLFGLGEREAETVEVRWPAGRRQRLVSPPADRYLVVAER
ncbi:MAG TPA: CRTAC1 family protein [Thermoanaerobaculia bacterium]|nr:CRTAC1 family protein [Thermoanaerobaculia bacterium]